MAPKQSDKLLRSKGNHKKQTNKQKKNPKKTTYRMGENSFKQCS